ncbi:MAG: NADPH:quinone reductase-like Zn-dependent oxidoreductase [Paraglaciecola sp.]
MNRADTLQRQGKYPAPTSESDILGLEMSGEVVEIHSQQNSPELINPQRFELGDKVFGLVAGGWWGICRIRGDEQPISIKGHVSLTFIESSYALLFYSITIIT